MKRIRTEDAVGHVLCHDMTQIIPGQFKGPRFRKGHVVRPEDIPVLLSMGKEQLYVWEMTPGMLHENDAAERLCALAINANMDRVKTQYVRERCSSDGMLVGLLDVLLSLTAPLASKPACPDAGIDMLYPFTPAGTQRLHG